MSGVNQQEEIEKMIQIAKDWVLEHSPDANIKDVAILNKTHLLESGVLDSIGLVDLLAFLEETTGNQIDLLELEPEDFATLDGLCKAALAANSQKRQ
jgi:acyl carrier protein